MLTENVTHVNAYRRNGEIFLIMCVCIWIYFNKRAHLYDPYCWTITNRGSIWLRKQKEDRNRVRLGHTLQWRHKGRDGASNHQPHDCFSTVYSGADQRKYQSSASLAFVRGIHRWPVNSPHKWPVTREMFPFDDVIIGAQIMATYTAARWVWKVFPTVILHFHHHTCTKCKGLSIYTYILF